MNNYTVTIPADDYRTLLIAAGTLFGISKALGEEGRKALLNDEQKDVAAKAAIEFIEEAIENL